RPRPPGPAFGSIPRHLRPGDITMRLGSTSFISAAVLFLASASAQADDHGWVDISNADAAPLLAVIAKYAPETAARYGVEGHDADVLDLKPDNNTRREAD